MIDRLKAWWIAQVVMDQWHTWIQHWGVGALTLSTDLRLGTEPYLTLAVAAVMVGREIRDVLDHRADGDPRREYHLDYALDWLTFLAGLVYGAWIAGAL